MKSRPVSYKRCGVDIDKANDFVSALKPLAAATRRPEMTAGIGGFGALFRIPKGYREPVLASSTDGVGTKLKLAQLVGRYEGLGIDLVAMNVNDILTLGAEPLFFLDYFAVGRIETRSMLAVVKGIAEGCRQAGASLIGGETAEMPGLYRAGDFDLGGFCVGVVERSKIIDGRRVRPGDSIIGVASSGFHSNGYSFVRKVFEPAFVKAHAEEILKPTRIYVKPVRALMSRVDVLAMAHITGGGFFDNIPRVLPAGCGAKVLMGSWPIPRVFGWIEQKARVQQREMYRTFNMGVGFILVTRPDRARKAVSILRHHGEHAWVIGHIVKGSGVTIQ